LPFGSAEHESACGRLAAIMHGLLTPAGSNPLSGQLANFRRFPFRPLSFIMHHLFKSVLLSSILSVAAFGADSAPFRPWAVTDINIESGVLWQIGSLTPIPYRLMVTQVSWLTKQFLSHEFADGSRIVVRHRLTVFGDQILQGPESHYIGFSGSPSIEWWDKTGKWSVFTGSGGGFGGIDSRSVAGGQGQDFTLNWFIRAGVQHVTDKNSRFSAGLMYQHMSNGGATKPNPGIDALGFTLGYTWSF